MLVCSRSVITTRPTLIRAIELLKFFMWSKFLFISSLILYSKSGPMGLFALLLKNLSLSPQSTSSKLRSDVVELLFRMVSRLSMLLLLRNLYSLSILRANKMSTLTLSWRVQASVSGRGPIMNAMSGISLNHWRIFITV